MPRQTARTNTEALWPEPSAHPEAETVGPSDAEPDAVIVTRETIAFACLATIRLLPPRQRVVLILREVLRWRAAEVAELLDTSVAAVNSPAASQGNPAGPSSAAPARVDTSPGPA